MRRRGRQQWEKGSVCECLCAIFYVYAVMFLLSQGRVMRQGNAMYCESSSTTDT